MTEFRQATEADIETISELENGGFVNPWTKEQFAYEIGQNEFARTWVLCEEGKIFGYVDYWIIFDQSTLNKLFVAEDYRRRGYGRLLLERALEDAKENRCLTMSLEVRVSNEKAIALYEKLGFEILLRKKAYYADGEDAFYMMRGVFTGH